MSLLSPTSDLVRSLGSGTSLGALEFLWLKSVYSSMAHPTHTTLGNNGMVKKKRFTRSSPALQTGSLLDQFKMRTGKVGIMCRVKDVSEPMGISSLLM